MHLWIPRLCEHFLVESCLKSFIMLCVAAQIAALVAVLKNEISKWRLHGTYFTVSINVSLFPQVIYMTMRSAVSKNSIC
jgi:hypothetical protein